MPPEPQTASELTQRLIDWSRVPGDESSSATAALECVAAEFSHWVGPRGFEALMSRALAEVRPAHPALEQLRYDPLATPSLTGVVDSVARHGADATARALAQLLETVLALCIRLIGGDLVTALVERSVENRLHDPAGRRPNLTTGVTRRDQD